MSKFIKTIFFLVVISFSLTTIADKIEKISISGNHRIETSTISEYLRINIGDDYTPRIKNIAIKNLYDTSLFENINIDYISGVLEVKVQETPFVSKVEFKGNSKIKTKLLSDELSTSAGESLRKAKIWSDVEKIKEIYKRSGRFSVHVKSKIETQKNNRVKVIFDIQEGPKTGIKEIYFVGNDNYKDSELKSIIMTKESRWFRFLETNDAYDPDRIELDKHLLHQFYNSVGFADFVIISTTADLLPTKEGFIITYSIEEGTKYSLGKIGLDNKLTNIDDKEILKFIKQDEGQVFNLGKMQDMADKIAGYLASEGYPQVDVSPKITPNRETGVVEVTMVVDQADKIFINKINIEGNLKTEDHVIRRQLKISEGDIFNRSKIERGERNIRYLDYFGRFSLKMAPTKKNDRYDINIDVEEKSTSSIGLELGYNTSGGPFGKISFIERNLVGTGRIFNTGAQIGRKSVHYYAGITDPAFMDKDLSAGINLFRREDGKGSGFANGEQKYSSQSTGARTSVGYDITEDLSHEIDYLIKKDHLSNAGDKSSIFIQEQIGTYISSVINHSLTYDRLDNRGLPKNGYLISGTQEFAGLGGDVKYIKHEIDGKYLTSFFENKYTLQFSAATGHIQGVSGKQVKISDRFNVGEHSLRGFANSGIGPRDKLTKEGLGGQKFYTFGAELTFPLGVPEEFNVAGSVFMDAGSLWDADSKTTSASGFHNSKSLRTSVGFGVTWITKIAPIRLDWGFPIKKEKYDETEMFHIKFSTSL